MKIQVCAVGRLRKGPERTLVNDYLLRFERTGRPLSLGPAREIEVEDRKNPGMAAQAAQLRKAIPEGAFICALDERGAMPTSPQFASLLARWRDDGVSDLAFVIGGADGLEPTFVEQSNYTMSLGKMVWPHMLVRVMLAEQLYRAAGILAGSPYHRA